MKNKRNWLGILVMLLVFGMMVVGCDNDSTNGNDSETIYDPEGIWDVSIYGQNATVIVNGNNYTFSGAGVTDEGTYIRDGNVGTLWSDGWYNSIGTVTLTSNTTMTLNLVSPSIFTGVFTGHKRMTQ